MGLRTAGAASVAAIVRVILAEVIQKQEAADEDSKRNPEVDVGGDYAK